MPKLNLKTYKVYLEDALREASRSGFPEIVKACLEEGADVNAKDVDGYTALMFASIYNHKEIVELLIANGANVNAKNEYGRTALIIASTNGYSKEIKEILKRAGAK